MRCTVVGAGAWGTALASVLATNGHECVLWAREPDVVEAVNAGHVNPRFLPGVMLPAPVRATEDLGDAVREADIVVFVTPSHVLREIARRCADATSPRAVSVVASKGIERDTLALMTEVVAEELTERRVVALSGPSFAVEVAVGQPTAVVAASADAGAAKLVQRALSSGSFRVYTHHDVTGVELGGALKNVVAVATGIAEGVGLGSNSRAALITRGLAEIARLGASMGASPATFAGLAGLGDLVLTCTGSLSRNRAVGIEVGKGAPLAEVLAGKDTVAEGVLNTQSALQLADRQRVEMPIVTAVHRVLFEGQAPRDAIVDLMTRELRPEHDG
jgi:glycerol-3-phosphate dehydrogenase (NAD(P)+)